VTTANGLRAYVLSRAGDPVVRITVAFPLGRLRERPDEAGTARLLLRLLTERGPTAGEPFQDRLEDLGTRLEVEEALDLSSISIEVLPASWREGLGLLIDILRPAQLDETAIRAYRTGTGYSEPTSRVEEEGFRPKVELERIVAGHPLSPPSPGLAITPEAVRALASRSLRPDRVVLGLGGDLPRSEVEAALVELSRGWEKGAEAAQSNPPRLSTPNERFYAMDVPELSPWVPRQGWIAIGRPVEAIPERERASVELLRAILGTRLNIAAREIRGLANHTIFLTPDTANGAGLLHLRTGGRQEAVAPLVHFCLEELRRIQSKDDAITDQELEEAKGILVLGEWQTALDGATATSSAYAVETVRYGSADRLLSWPEAVRAVTASEVKAVAEKYLAPTELVTVVVGPLESIRKARHPRWPVDLDSLASPGWNPGRRPTE
jgi:zinc protease